MRLVGQWQLGSQCRGVKHMRVMFLSPGVGLNVPRRGGKMCATSASNFFYRPHLTSLSNTEDLNA